MTNTLKDFFEGKTSEYKPLGYFDEDKVYTIDDYVEVAKVKGEALKAGVDLSNSERGNVYDERGNLLETPRESYVVNAAIAFINKVKVNGDNTVSVVTDYRAITESKSGQIYTPFVSAYKIGADGTKGKKTLKVLAVEQVSAADFLSDYKDTLDTADAERIYEVITHSNSGIKQGLSLDAVFG